MEKELNCSTLFGMEISSEQLPNRYFHPSCEMSSIDQNDPFESALSSMVSSPTAASNGGDVIRGDGTMIRELMGRLGSICDSGEISPESCCIATGNNSTNTSCYSTPLNSPPKRFNLSPLLNNGGDNFPNYPPNLAALNPDPGFVERVARFSCFGNNNLSGGELGMKNFDVRSGKLSRVSSSKSMKAGEGGNSQIDVNSEKKFGGISRGSTPENGEIGDQKEGSSMSEKHPTQNDANSRKRKSARKTNVKDKVEAEKEESNAKRSKTEDEEVKKENAEESNENNSNNTKEKQNNNKNNNNENNEEKEPSKPEPPKDYIHVRARRGQATDSHSLAERVRREKISERMKFLQDLVPGCNKVTGKATVLDEIINYVQSLQRQVELLSMKLATVNPITEFNMDALLSKDVFSTRGSALAQTMYPLDQNSAQAFSVGYQQSSQQMPLTFFTNGLSENPFSLNPPNAAGIRQNPSLQPSSLDGFGVPMTQMPNFWEDDLQSIVQMGIAQNQTQTIPGNFPNTQMKAEL